MIGSLNDSAAQTHSPLWLSAPNFLQSEVCPDVEQRIFSQLALGDLKSANFVSKYWHKITLNEVWRKIILHSTGNLFHDLPICNFKNLVIFTRKLKEIFTDFDTVNYVALSCLEVTLEFHSKQDKNRYYSLSKKDIHILFNENLSELITSTVKSVRHLFNFQSIHLCFPQSMLEKWNKLSEDKIIGWKNACFIETMFFNPPSVAQLATKEDKRNVENPCMMQVYFDESKCSPEELQTKFVKLLGNDAEFNRRLQLIITISQTIKSTKLENVEGIPPTHTAFLVEFDLSLKEEFMKRYSNFTSLRCEELLEASNKHVDPFLLTMITDCILPEFFGKPTNITESPFGFAIPR